MTADDAVRPGSPAALRTLNRVRLRDALLVLGETSQADLARETGLAPATVSNIVRELAEDGEITVRGDGPRRRMVRMARQSGYVVGVDYGHRHVTVAICDRAHEILAEHRAELASREVTAKNGLAITARLLDEALADVGIDRHQIVGAGMGLPAPIDGRTGRVGSPTILPGWVGANASDMVTAALGLPVPVAVDNDANLGALAERMWGAGRGVDNMVYLKVSDGVGAGLIINGRIYAGSSGTAGEIGHTTVDEYGEVCRCGNRGCLETLVSSKHVLELLAVADPTPPTSVGEVVARATAGDRASARVLEDIGRQVGRAIADLCNLLNPDLIVFGGEMSQAADVMVPAIMQAVRRCGVESAAADLDLRRAELGPRTHVLGAVALALALAEGGVTTFDVH